MSSSFTATSTRGTHTPPSDLRQGSEADNRSQSAQPSRVLLFANPYSGSGPNRLRVKRLVNALHRQGVEAELVWDKARRDEWLADPTLPQRCQCVVSAGGDGSLTDVLNGLDTAGTLRQVKLYHFPVGTENLFAAEFGHTRHPEQAAAAILAGHTRPVDLGRCNGRLFHLMVSAGLDADVVHRVAKWRQLEGHKLRRVHQLRYAPRLLASLARYQYPAVTLTTDTGETHQASHVFVFNLPRYGGGLTLGRGADPHDGLLDYIALPNPGVRALANYGTSVLLRRHTRRDDLPRGRARQLTLSADHPDTAPLQLDGDPMGHAPVTLTAEPAALQIIQPAPLKT